MKRNKETKKGLSRRNFIKTKAGGVGTTALAGFSRMSSIPRNVTEGHHGQEDRLRSVLDVVA